MGLKHDFSVSIVSDVGDTQSADVKAEGPVHALEEFLRLMEIPESAVNQVHILFRGFGKVKKEES